MEQEVLPPILERRGLLGFTVAVRHPDGLGNLTATVGLAPPGHFHDGYVAAADGPEVQGYRLGWGLYQTAYAVPNEQGAYEDYGDGKGRPGIELVWSRTHGTATVDANLFLLAEDETTARWRAGQLKTAVSSQ